MHGVERHATSGEIPQFQKLTSPDSLFEEFARLAVSV